ncbi:MAG TPA: CDP-diacylglycerol--serine O-phosphatidyltransferase [Gemmataceae bacterium]|nr:CDP-diacylglycerol--serine O-phosphatidyltransferase [Gemmataceae bacterium]
MKKIAILPTLLTLGNAICGFAAIAYASKINPGQPGTERFFAISGWLIFAAMVFDALDGYVARLSRVASKFGAELDSLCDAISFGLAPAYLLMRMGPGWEPLPSLHQALAGIAALYMVCAILRLARYNVETAADPASSKRFRGLPSPGAAGCIAALGLVRGTLPQLAHDFRWLDMSIAQQALQIWATVGALVVALLMVSRVPYPHLTKQMLRGRRHFSHLIQVLVLAYVIFVVPVVALVVIFWLYGLGIPLRHALARSLRPRRFPRTEGPSVTDTVPH